MIKLIVFLPLIAAIIVGLNTSKLSVKVSHIITVSAISISAILSYIVFEQVVLEHENLDVEMLSWITSGTLNINWALKIDSLTAVMLIVVTTVSALVHIYSIGYMNHDPYPQRFMSYLSLFSFFMLMLVTSNNFIQLYLGWEGVGLCSYLLIGFWYKKESANKAAMKAFIVNRVGDFGFALGIFAIFFAFDSVMFADVFAAVPEYASENSLNLTIICLLLFIGAMGKSAQLGLHTWLPDAMEGPTPVSALIHAATMVTAGVFMVARCSPMFEQSQFALDVVTTVGAATCIFAATVAITQNDIKRVIAYSTCSQLGYMFFACGVSAYSAGIFHLMTHGFFKALLFLGAGSVIHAMSNEQDMRKMGALWKKIPLTFALMIIGTLAITGFPGLAGYYSKDMILESAYAAGHNGNIFGEYAYWIGILAATLTAFYSWRLIFMTFFGKFRSSNEILEHVHESPKVMTIPLILLALGAVFSGVIMYNLGIVSSDLSVFSNFWNGAIYTATEETNHFASQAHHVYEKANWIIQHLPTIVGIIGFIIALLCYIFVPALPVAFSKAFNPIYKFLLNKWYFDELYDLIFIRPTKCLGLFLWKVGDVRIIDKFGPDGFALASRKIAKIFSKAQTGLVYHYTFVMLIGVTFLITTFIYSLIN